LTAVRVLPTFLLLATVPFATACPREVTEPMRPDGRPCVIDEDCTPPGASCGLVFACVDERCEEESSRAEPCE
jgi:hypothetical protein